MGGAGVARKKIGVGEIPQRVSQKKFSPRRASYSLVGFERFVSELKTENGQPLALEPFQRRILRDHFAGVIEEVVVIPKKNGKTTLFSALALYHLENWPEAYVVLVATSKDQARQLFRQAANLVRFSGLEKRFDVRSGYKAIRLQGQKDGPILQVFPADPKTVDGEFPTLALVDELHRHRTLELYGILRDGLAARRGRMVSISTAGADEDSSLGEIRRTAMRLQGFKRRGTYCYVKTPDNSFALHEWSLRPDDNTDDIKLVKKANPAPWHTLASLRRSKNSPTTKPGQWLRFYCNIWTAGEDPWLLSNEWDRLKVDIGGLEEGDTVWAMVVPGINGAIVIAGRKDEGVAVQATIFEGPPNWSLYEETLLDIHEQYQLETVFYDPAFQRCAELLEEQGLTLLDRRLTTEALTVSTTTLERLIQNGLLRHDGNERLRAHVLAGIIKDSERGKRLVNTQRTHGLIAMAVACHHATGIPQDTDPMVMFR